MKNDDHMQQNELFEFHRPGRIVNHRSCNGFVGEDDIIDGWYTP